jgi:hypothetical protein
MSDSDSSETSSSPKRVGILSELLHDSDNSEDDSLIEDICKNPEFDVLPCKPVTSFPQLKKKEDPKKKVFFKEDIIEKDLADKENILLSLPKKDPNLAKKQELEKRLAEYLASSKVTPDISASPVTGKEAERLSVTENYMKEKEIDSDKKNNEKIIEENNYEENNYEENVEEALQRMQYEEKIKQLITHLENVKFTISPQELSHLCKTYPIILIPEVAATFLSGSNIAAVNNMITYGFKLDRRTEDFYIKMKEEVLEGVSEKEKKRLEQYYATTDNWLKENLKDKD